jgi:hypothetical protein
VCGGEDAANGERIQRKRGVRVSWFSIFVSASAIPVARVFQSGVALRSATAVQIRHRYAKLIGNIAGLF